MHLDTVYHHTISAYMMRITKLARLAMLAGSCLSVPAYAQSLEPTQSPSGDVRHHRSAHSQDATADEIVVAGHPPVDFGLLASSVTLEGDDLLAQMRGQLGEILARIPGVSATSFAPGASRPVLRGMDGDRIRVLVDGIGTIDASSVSADHAVVFDPLTVDHIDVVHGPAVLLFGGQAIGGAINALDKRIPRMVPQRPQGVMLGGYGTSARERSISAAMEFPLAERLAIHLDASWRKSGDLRTGGLINSQQLREQLLAESAHHAEEGETEEAAEFAELAELSSRLPNSSARATTLGAGIAFIDAGGNLGISVQQSDSRYAVPIRPGAGHGHEEAMDDHGGGSVAIDLRQTRVDLRGALEMGAFIQSLQLRGAYGDYRHTELEDGDEGTIFASKGHEFRVDLVQAEQAGWRGRTGFQLQGRKLMTVGPEAFTPDNETSRFGIFTLQSLDLGSGMEAEAAGRYERASVKASRIGFSRGFDLWSGAAGLTWQLADGWKLGAHAIRGARAPAPEELLSNGVHVATQAFELGDHDFKRETSTSLEAYLRYAGDGLRFSLTTYSTRFSGFIAALPTGDEVDGLPVFAYGQYPARFLGFEADTRFDAMQWPGGKLALEIAADYTRAKIKGIGPVPRIPPFRLRGGAELELGDLHLHGEMEWNASQKRVATFENPTAGFAVVNFSADWHPGGADRPFTIILQANNLFNVIGRRAASFTRDFVPIAGRDLRLTARIAF